jgi:hypothetical protein
VSLPLGRTRTLSPRPSSPVTGAMNRRRTRVCDISGPSAPERRTARHEGFPADAARSPGMRPAVSVPGVHFTYAMRIMYELYILLQSESLVETDSCWLPCLLARRGELVDDGLRGMRSAGSTDICQVWGSVLHTGRESRTEASLTRGSEASDTEGQGYYASHQFPQWLSRT